MEREIQALKDTLIFLSHKGLTSFVAVTTVDLYFIFFPRHMVGY